MTSRIRVKIGAAILAAWMVAIGGLAARAQTAPPQAGRETELEARLKKMEAMNARLAEQLEAVAKQNKALAEKVDALSKPAKKPIRRTAQAGGNANQGMDDQPEDVETDEPVPPDSSPAQVIGNSATSSGAINTSGDDQPDDIATDEPEPPSRMRNTTSIFDEGFKWTTPNDEYELQVHSEAQLDVRAYQQARSSPTDQSNFYVNRMRVYFNGHLTKPIDYSVSINKGLGNLDLLDAYLNFKYDPRFQFRVGRYRVPFMYEWYALSNQFLATPERSIFAQNYGYSRNFALMGHGEAFGDRLDYAVAVANGPRNSYYDQNSHKDILAYLNFRPFEQSETLKALQHLNFGGSVAYGIQDQAALPQTFRTAANASESAGASLIGPEFLHLNSNVLERGRRELWELHTAYYYKGLTLIGGWESGFNSYGFTNHPTIVHLPTTGYHAQFAYLVTGEHIERRFFVEPLHPFDLRKGKFGLGAFEIQSRYDFFSVGNQVFTGGLADGNLWTNNVYATDVGVNWYLNKYTKIYFDWQHSVFGNPVLYRPGGFQKTSDLFWLRFQVYF